MRTTLVIRDFHITNGKSLRTARKLLEKYQFGYGYQNEPAVLGHAMVRNSGPYIIAISRQNQFAE